MRICLDLDGVLGDFVGAAGKLLNFDPRVVTKWDFYEQVGVSKTAFWNAIHNQGSVFWEEIEPYPWYGELYSRCKRTAPTQILTSPSDHESSYQGKAAWLKKHLFLKPNQYFLGSEKTWLATSETVLIDDSDENCEAFNKAGGHVILFPQPWNANRFLADKAMEYTMQRLAELEGVIK